MNNIIRLNCTKNEIIKALEHLLQIAEKGDLESFTMVAIAKREDEDYNVNHSIIMGDSPRLFALLGGLKTIEHRLVNYIEGLDED